MPPPSILQVTTEAQLKYPSLSDTLECLSFFSYVSAYFVVLSAYNTLVAKEMCGKLMDQYHHCTF